MTQEHPITPPPELAQDWSCDCPLTDPFNRELYIATLAARWGADQELEACCEWVSQLNYDDYSYGDSLRAARRRPKPPSLKEQALGLLDEGPVSDLLDHEVAVIRRAIESLPD